MARFVILIVAMVAVHVVSGFSVRPTMPPRRIASSITTMASSSNTNSGILQRYFACFVVATGLLAPSTPAFAVNEASELFAKADVAIRNNQIDYKDLENEWVQGQKTLGDTSKLLFNTQASLNQISSQVAKFDATIDKLLADDIVTLQQLQNEVNTLKTSTGLKYQAAETAAQSPRSNPATTAALFLKASNEASTLAQDEKNLGSLANTVGVNVILQKKANEITTSIATTNNKAGDIQQNEKTGLNDMLVGLQSNSKTCKESLTECAEFGSVGIKQFKRGAKTVEAADENFDRLKKEVQNTLKTLEGIQSDLSRSVTNLDSIVLDDDAWEEKTKLNVKSSKGYIKVIAGKYSTALKDTEAMVGKIKQVQEDP